MADRLGLYNGALRQIGERKLKTLAEDREPKRVLDDLWDQAVAYCLEEGQWHFAIRSVELIYAAAITPAFGYQYAFAIPSDYVRQTGMGSWPDGGNPQQRIHTEAGYFWADVSKLYLTYVSKDPAYGLDLSRWPATFAKYVETYLAAEACEALTQNATKGMELRKIAKTYRTDARSKDALNEPTRFLPQGSWVTSRGGGWGWRRDGGSTSGNLTS